MTISNRTLQERHIARKIISLKVKQNYHRKKWLDFDAEISLLKSKFNECVVSKIKNKLRKPKKGDYYND